MKIPIFLTIVLTALLVAFPDPVEAGRSCNSKYRFFRGTCYKFRTCRLDGKVTVNKTTVRDGLCRRGGDDDDDSGGGGGDDDDDSGNDRKCRRNEKTCCRCVDRCDRNKDTRAKARDCIEDDCKNKCRRAGKSCKNDRDKWWQIVTRECRF